MRFIPFEKFPRVERRLRKLLRSKSPTVQRDALAYGLGLHGLRCGEVINLTVGDLDELDEQLRVATLKGGKPRKIDLGPGFFAALHRLAGNRAATAPLFATSKGTPVDERHWQRGFRELSADVLGGKGLNFHGLRHTFAMRVYLRTKDLQRVMARLGHRQPSSTQHYVDAYRELDDATIAKYERVDVLPSLRAKRRPKNQRSPERRADSREIVRAKSKSVRKRHRKAGLPIGPLLRLFGSKVVTGAELERRRNTNRRSG